MMATIGNSTITVTLSPTTPDITLTGSIDAIADIGTYSIRIGDTLVPEPISAAVFGPKTGHFTVINTGTVISPGNGLDFGILLAAGGTILNSGQITAGNGIGILTGKGAKVENTGTILAVQDGAEILDSRAFVQNSGLIEVTSSVFSSGTITQAAAAILAAEGGTVTNGAAGTIIGGTGITLSTAAIPAAIPQRGWLTENLLTPSSAFLKSPLTLQP